MAKGDSPKRLCIIVDGRLIMLFANRRASQTSHDQLRHLFRITGSNSLYELFAHAVWPRIPQAPTLLVWVHWNHSLHVGLSNMEQTFGCAVIDCRLLPLYPLIIAQVLNKRASQRSPKPQIDPAAQASLSSLSRPIKHFARSDLLPDFTVSGASSPVPPSAVPPSAPVQCL